MEIQSIFGSIASVLTRNPLPWAIVAGITAKATQIAASSFFRASPRFISLIARASSIPGGSALINFGPSILIALATGALLRYFSTSIKPIISASELINIFTYDSTHSDVDRVLREDAAKKGRPLVYEFPKGGRLGLDRTAYICLNYPKQSDVGDGFFCDAFSYADNNSIQIATIADGCCRFKESQLSARDMVDNFIDALLRNERIVSSEQLVMKAALDSQKSIEKNHNPLSHDNHYETTMFLGGLIFKATDGKRYFTGVNCGNCKLYRLSREQFTEVTKLARTNATDTDGRFGPNRTFSVEVQSGDKLFFMTDGLHDNLDQDHPEEKKNETFGAADQRKLSTLQKLTQDKDLEQRIMISAYDYSKTLYNEIARGTSMSAISSKEFPGKLDNMTLLVVQVR